MKILLGLLLVALALTIDRPEYDRLYKNASVQSFKQEALWFDQVLDHYNYDAVAAKTWKQRYWVMDTYFNPKVGPVFLYICGEWVCSGIPSTRTWVAELAQRMQGIVLVLEHRFYGDSLPFR
jgi:hypothetical protein